MSEMIISESDRQQLLNLFAAEAQETEGFSLVPKWVAKKAGLNSAQSPFDEMDEVLGGAGDDVEAALDEYAVAKVG